MADLIPSPSYTITGNVKVDEGKYIHQVSPSWLVIILPFEEPAASYNPDLNQAMKTKPAIVIQNDAISISVSRPKNSFAKTASVSVKLTDTNYQNACSTGDWIFIWMSDYQEDIDRLVSIFYGASRGSLNDWESGLKFAGRIIDIGAGESVASGGTYVQTQNIQAQMFVELASSLYYTFIRQSIVNFAVATPSGAESQTDTAPIEQQFNERNIRAALGNTSKNFLQMFQLGTATRPDEIISNLIVLTMGVTASQNLANRPEMPLGTPNDAIMIPSEVARIFGRPQKKYLWENYLIQLGMQKYSNRGTSVWEKFQPDVDSSKLDRGDIRNTVFWYSPVRLKGVTPYYPPQWNNTSIWNVWSQYLHNELNEMFTCLRINANNQIVPTIVVREQPWSTGLFNYLQNGRPMDNVRTTGEKVERKTTKSIKQEKETTKEIIPSFTPSQKDNVNRTFFHNLPRWRIDESMIYSVDVSVSEGQRCNFVQFWARAASLEQLGVDASTPDNFMYGQLGQGNFIIDEKDIRRNGLRAQIFESSFGGVEITGSQIGNDETPKTDKNSVSWTSGPLWARMKADWLFNGHLKLSGSANLQGIREPICEGDNIEIKGILYHIEGLSFNCSISPNGTKHFAAQASLSNGMVASSLNETTAPLYAIHRSHQTKNLSGPGLTEVQTRVLDRGRTSTGEEV